MNVSIDCILKGEEKFGWGDIKILCLEHTITLMLPAGFKK